MAEVFEPVELTWKGQTYKIPADKVMPLICRVEDVITMARLSDAAANGDLPLAKIACAYAVMLRYAGAKAKDDEVYQAMFASGETASRMRAAVEMLLGLMIPPSVMQQEGGQDSPFGSPSKTTSPPKKTTSGGRSKKGASSAKRTKSG